MWNGSNGKKVIPQKKRKNFPYGKFFFGILGILIIVGAVLCFAPNGEEIVEVKEKPSVKKVAVRKPKIKKVATPTNKVVKVTKRKGPPPGVEKDEKGVYRYPGGARWYDPNENRSVVTNLSRTARLFKYQSERQIAGLLEIKPGATMFGTMHYGRNLKEDFLKSLEEPFVYDKDEPVEDRELRMAVEETKRELKARMDKGEDIVKILKDTREELQMLGAFREDLKKQINQVVRDASLTDEDVAKFAAEANKMLENEGLPPIKAPGVVMRQILLHRETKRKQ